MRFRRMSLNLSPLSSSKEQTTDMEREEKFIIQRFGRRTPFRVPEGYFDDFTSQLMQNLPQKGPVPAAKIIPTRLSVWKRFRPVSIAAASICVAIFGVRVYVQNHHQNSADVQETPMAHASPASSYSAMDAMADYTMLDMEDMYTYMEDAD